MFSFVQEMFASRTNPIGVDFGADCLRLAQVQRTGRDFKLVAAASTDLPVSLRDDPQGQLAFFAENVRDLLAKAPFHGRHAILALPASAMHILNLRLAPMDEQALTRAIVFQSRGKLPFDPSQAVLRHIVAGQTERDNQPGLEVIVMAAAREWIGQFLAAAAKARLDVVGMNVEPMAMVDCFANVHHRGNEQKATRLFVDIGATSTHVTIVRQAKIIFVRNIPVGGDHLTQAAATALRIRFEDAKTLRIKLAAVEVPVGTPSRQDVSATATATSSERRLAREVLTAGSTAVLQAPQLAAADEFLELTPSSQAQRVRQACRDQVAHLIEKLELCRRDHETTFPDFAVDRLVFVGGEARQRGLCRQIAKQMALPSQVGDPLCRMARISDIGIESGIDRRAPQPAWAVAVGLSMGTPEPAE